VIEKNSAMIEGCCAPELHELQEPLFALNRTLNLESFWCASLHLVGAALPYHSCSLLFRITDYQPRAARHYVAAAEKPYYTPATSLSVSRPYLAAHPRIDFYTYSQIVAADPDASSRRHAQESVVGDWNEFVHLAFWKEADLDAVLSVRRAPYQPAFTAGELHFLHRLHPVIDAGLFRIREIEAQRTRVSSYERFLEASRQPMMFLNAQGELLFATSNAQRVAKHWNRTLPARGAGPRAPRLPEEIPQILQDRATFGLADWDGASATTIEHPGVHALSLRIERNPSTTELMSSASESPGYLLTFNGYPLLSEAPAQAQVALRQLSHAERRVALLVAEGLRNDEIAARLSRSRRTVEFQLNAIYRKLDLSCRTQLVRALN